MVEWGDVKEVVGILKRCKRGRGNTEKISSLLQYVKPGKGGNKPKEVFVRKSEIHFDLRPIGKNILKRCHPYLQISPKFGFMENI